MNKSHDELIKILKNIMTIEEALEIIKKDHNIEYCEKRRETYLTSGGGFSIIYDDSDFFLLDGSFSTEELLAIIMMKASKKDAGLSDKR